MSCGAGLQSKDRNDSGESMKKTIYSIIAVMFAVSAVSCGRTVQRVEYSGSDSVSSTKPAEFQAAELTEAETEAVTEAPTNVPPPPVEVNVSLHKSRELAGSSVIEGFETVMQTPELPTGCEITALAQTLNFYGFGIDKTELCDTFMPMDINGYYTMNDVYLGDPRTNYGYGCNAPVIEKAANDYFDYLGSDWYALDLTGVPLEEVFCQIGEGRPVIVWSTIGQRQTHAEYEFTLGCGEEHWFNPYQHCLTVYGYDYDSGTVHVADPLVGNIEYNMEIFEWIYNEMGSQAVMLCGNDESAGKDYTTDKEKKEWLKKHQPTNLEFLFGEENAE